MGVQKIYPHFLNSWVLYASEFVKVEVITYTMCWILKLRGNWRGFRIPPHENYVVVNCIIAAHFTKKKFQTTFCYVPFPYPEFRRSFWTLKFLREHFEFFKWILRRDVYWFNIHIKRKLGSHISLWDQRLHKFARLKFSGTKCRMFFRIL